MALKPVVFVQGKYAYNNQNTTQQLLLLKALQVTQDPKKLRQMIGVRAVADVYRTLDKIAMRKEYHEALAACGLSFDFIAQGLKQIATAGEKDADRLNAFKVLLKSIGLDSYAESANTSGGWEDALLKLQSASADGVLPAVPSYDVSVPEMPEHIRIAKEKANQETRKLYD